MKYKEVLKKAKKNFTPKPIVTAFGSPTAVREMYGKKRVKKKKKRKGGRK